MGERMKRVIVSFPEKQFADFQAFVETDDGRPWPEVIRAIVAAWIEGKRIHQLQVQKYTKQGRPVPQ